MQGIGGPSPTYGQTGVEPAPVELDPGHPYRSALQRIRQGVAARLGDRRLAAVAHRVVHGGNRYTTPVRIDPDVLEDLRDVGLEIAELMQQKIAAEDRLVKLDIRAPQAGIVKALYCAEGEMVTEGAALVELEESA